ncbi:uncharacterized protein LOC128893949 isoform X1 [Hylaeus anthracinus]|uniref:uncharacterized protein LOC128893949 isoform X1 n=1 Tax=Hylaeus anthracinus TaxID=313031 RepID=UPI0023B9B6EF|nr:uncharacterized protein LOC128893949 isoform X1 [Hylaeus anthracinus]
MKFDEHKMSDFYRQVLSKSFILKAFALMLLFVFSDVRHQLRSLFLPRALSTEDKLQYNFYPVASGQLQFRVKTPNDAHIALTTGPEEADPMYEVFIGGWSNSKSVIRKNRAKPEAAETETPGILSGDEFRGFWIRWGDGAISVGKEGEPSSFLTYTDPEPFGIGYFGICTGWGASGEWLIEGHGKLSTRNELVYAFRNVRGGAVLVEVRAKSNAHIALTNRKAESSPMYEIMLGGWENTASVIRYDRKQPDKVRTNTPNLLNENDTKKFAISWLDGLITVRVGDLNGPAIMEWQDPKPFGVSYVGVRTGWGATGKWKLRSALYPPRPVPGSKNTNPSAPPPPVQGLEMGEVCWCDASGGMVPPGAVEGGRDDEPLFVGRAYHEGALLPGKVKPGHAVCYVAWGGQEHGKTEYQVLCGCNPAWVPTSGNNIPPNAIPGGESEDGEALYVGRVNHEDTVTIGKVQPSHSVCYIAFAGSEVAFPDYEIMVSQ